MKHSNTPLRDVTFKNLMTKRIFRVLIIANPYDAFMLEDDGRIEGKIFNEYTELGLRYPPAFTQVSTTEEARAVVTSMDVNLVICMPGNADNDAFDVARTVKADFPDLPCVVLTPFSHGITRRMQHEDLSIFDYVFCWLGNTNLILSIIKLIEDKMNLDHDIAEAGVQVIMLVEDSIRFYSSFLPNLYSFILAQSQRFATEALNPHAAALRMRGRPKVILARNYDEAVAFFDKYKENMLGVISDCRFPISSYTQLSGDSEKVEDAGFRLLRYIRQQDEYIPLVMESAETENKAKAEAEHFRFIDKKSKKISVDLRKELEEHMGFGDFLFRDPKTHEVILRVRSLKELQDHIFTIPRDSMLYHISRNHVSRWLSARAIFPVSAFLKHITWHKLQDVDAHRQIIFDAIVQYRHMKNIGTVAVFDRLKFDAYSHFARIGEGSLGGKGRGLAFLDNIIKAHEELHQYDNVDVCIPMTLVLCTDIFDQFMENNDLYPIALSDAPDDEILQAFLKAQLPESLRSDCEIFINATECPIAIRSSSLLEDSHYQPFAGVYSTYMIPYLDDKDKMLRLLAKAIKSVYASVYYKDSKAYMTATSNLIDQEKMAVVLQEVVGKTHQTGDRKLYYPNLSGVLRSINYYPLGDEKSEEGIASLALGLGKYIVDGGITLRVCPYHPRQVLQMSEMDMALKETQTMFYAIDMDDADENFKVDDGFNIKNVRVKEADMNDGTMMHIVSTYDPYDQIIRDGLYEGGRKVISYAGVLKNGVAPIPEMMQMAMKYGADAMRRPVEIEFACNINADRSVEFYLLQIRPIVDSKLELNVNLTPYFEDTLPKDNNETVLISSRMSLGHGVNEDLVDVVYVKTDENFTASNNPAIADDIERINRKFLDRGENYILAGPGRWGSSDYWLGVPVKWPHINAAKLIVEVGLDHYRIDPSQGTHFFQNLTSLGVGYFTVNPYRNEGVFRKDILDAIEAVEETKYVRHVRFPKPFRLMMDGMKQMGVVVVRE